MFKNKTNILNNFKKIEKKTYKTWEKKGYFKPQKNIFKKNFSIIIPPPNITGNLHIGHALQQTIIDITARYNRMKGKNVLLKVGTDHAGIATQIMILKKIKTKKSKKFLIKKTWLWKKKIVNIINNQIRRLGISVDWSNEIFTMNNIFSNAVKKIFINLYNKKIIYKGKKLVNWNNKLNTVISDLEIKYKKSKSYLWYFKYPLQNNFKTLNGYPYIVVSTTRPETILGDTGIGVNPLDKRYKNLIGKKAIVPFVNRCIPIISDKIVDIKKGSGCIKITPGHDFNDYEIAKKNKLDILNILNFNGKIKEKLKKIKIKKKNSNYFNFIPKKFRNLSILKARKLIILNLKLLGFLNKIENCKINVPYSDRQDVIIEPMLTNQWFLKSNILANNAITVIKKKKIVFLNKKYENMYLGWMKNIQDWCISRQLWWGHRIPAWYDKNGKIYVGNNENEIRKKNKINKNIVLKQDNDVLDTWFSSSLWTFVSLGWPKKKREFLYFHPTNIIFSGYDIIFFWIARMIMLTMFFLKDNLNKPQVPFKFIYITGLICDIEGKKMSKSMCNTIDPIDIIEGISFKELLKKRLKNIIDIKKIDKITEFTKKQFPNNIIPYGSDVLRFFLTNISNTNRSIYLNFKQLEKSHNFYNKLVNAYKFIMIYYKKYNKNLNISNIYNNINNFILIDRCIQIKLNIMIKDFCESLNNYNFYIAVNILYKFIWYEFCNWYIEFSKIILKYGSLIEKKSNYYTLFYVFEKILKIAHPIIPFITENIWKEIKKKINNINNINDTIMLESFPKFNNNIYNKKDLEDFKWIKNIIISIRNIKSKMFIKKKIDILFWNTNKNIKRRINENKNIIKKIANLKNIKILSKKQKKPHCFIKIIDKTEILFPFKFINKIIELNYIKNEIILKNNEILKIKFKLNNKKFLNNAPEIIIIKKLNILLNLNKNKNKLLKQFIVSK
ncbi:valine--tRNA ligase [Enterobacteriaceae bacterium ET-AT1-13]|nr:valine--tRNA ligase [Enterobacteriaceae bacterium ET-AT1-13]WMC17664.1 MAG: valine--tRNA ligase [Enterobacteriaceae bacterium PSmelAO3-2]WMC17868.1 MAG: valine--tRNA ligase [Enterobacteriaceae bacterium PSmelAO3-1]